MNKYGARKTTIDGIVFDSQREARRYSYLYLLRRAGEISDLRLQVKYNLIPSQKDARGKTLERPVDYIADFVYKDAAGNTIVEDAKGKKTKDYIIKRKLMLYVHGIRVQEV